ncbi:MAG TPA: SWIM zinc finger family protein [Chloroflexota bacterium]|nr:SWIM zinc finger family protein [Chloroflexota bacterium]
MQQATTRQTSRKPYTPTVSRASYKPHVRRLGTHGLFRVQSATNADTYYIVDTVDHTCTCPAGQHGRQCWHLKAACGLVFFPAREVESAPTVIHCGAALQEAFGA